MPRQRHALPSVRTQSAPRGGTQMKLTQTIVNKLAISNSKPEQVFLDDEIPGLGLRIRAAGSRKYVVNYRQGDRRSRYTIGKANVWTLERCAEGSAAHIVGGGQRRGPGGREGNQAGGLRPSLLSGGERLPRCDRADHEAPITRRMHSALEQGLEATPRPRPWHYQPGRGCFSPSRNRQEQRQHRGQPRAVYIISNVCMGHR